MNWGRATMEDVDSSSRLRAALRELWIDVVDAVVENWRWGLTVVPVTVFTLWSVVVSGSRLPLLAQRGQSWFPLDWLSSPWQLGILLGLIALLCAMGLYAQAEDPTDEAGFLIVIPFLGLGAVLLVGLLMCAAAAQRGGVSALLLLPFLGQLASSGVTLYISEAL